MMPFKSCGPGGTRTPNHLIRSQGLYPLSYWSGMHVLQWCKFLLILNISGIICLQTVNSYRELTFYMWTQRDSNSQPSHP